jgi:hypothetical protein
MLHSPKFAACEMFQSTGNLAELVTEGKHLVAAGPFNLAEFFIPNTCNCGFRLHIRFS